MAQPTSIQRGTITLAAGNTSVSVEAGVDDGFATAVARSRTILIYSVRGDQDTPTDAPNHVTSATLDAAGDTITFTRNGTSSTITIEWALHEFASDSGVTVQYVDVASSANGSGNVTITSVDLTKAFVIPLGVVATSGGTGRWQTRWRLTSATNLEWSRVSAIGNVAPACMVVEYPDCVVQQVDFDITAGTATTFDETIDAVDPAATALFGSQNATNWPDSASVFKTMSVPNSTTVRLTREGSTSHTFGATVFVVEFTDGTVVYSETAALHDTTLLNDTLGTAVDPDVTMLICGHVTEKISGGRDNGDNQSRTHPTLELTSSTNVALAKGASQGTVDMVYQLIEFAASSGGGGTLFKPYFVG